MITELVIRHPGQFAYKSRGNNRGARFDMFLIDKAWEKGCDFEKEADGAGAGLGTLGGWSAIRDSSDEAIVKMLEKALNFLFPEKFSLPADNMVHFDDGVFTFWVAYDSVKKEVFRVPEGGDHWETFKEMGEGKFAQGEGYATRLATEEEVVAWMKVYNKTPL